MAVVDAVQFLSASPSGCRMPEECSGMENQRDPDSKQKKI